MRLCMAEWVRYDKRLGDCCCRLMLLLLLSSLSRPINEINCQIAGGYSSSKLAVDEGSAVQSDTT